MTLRSSALRSPLPPDLAPLEEIAMDLRWTWSHGGDALWKAIDEEAWERTENPYVVLQSLTAERIQELDCNTAFKAQLQALIVSRRDYLARSGLWANDFQQGALRRIAYFSLEFGLAGALPLYAGGLGVLAGDYLKGASDLGVPLIGIGLLYQEGYFRQLVDLHQGQRAVYPVNDPDSLPIARVYDRRGAWLTVPVEFPGRVVRFRVWQAQVGRVPLYLLDSNDPWNGPIDRGIASKLYGGGPELRFMQEIALGIGGWRLIEALDLEVDICHLNEGHAAFAALERARCFMERHRVGFWEALWATRAGNVFTTHTTVAAAFDRYEFRMLAKYGRDYAEALGIPTDDIIALGQPPRQRNAPFNMALLAARLCATVNGVSQLHAEVSRTALAELYPRWPLAQVPVAHVTNGVHFASWDSVWSDAVWTQACGKSRWLGTTDSLGTAIDCLSDEQLWSLKGAQRADLVAYARRRLARQLAQRGNRNCALPASSSQPVLDPNVLTLGFARRFTAYKRPNLLLSDTARLTKLLTNPQFPLQLIVAGKAHPDDEHGKHLLQQWVQLASTPELRHRLVFLEDYDIPLAQELVQGIDVWVSTSRRPLEACGTSGMKALVNGGLNLAVLDGWWAEAYTPEVGWAIPEPDASSRDLDAAQARLLYELLESEVVPQFYQRDASGVPRAWIARMRASMSRLTPRFSTNRMLSDYVRAIYLPAAELHARRTQANGRAGAQLAHWAQFLAERWPQLHFGEVQATVHDGDYVISALAYLGEIAPEMIEVQLYAEAADVSSAPYCEPMVRGACISGAAHGYRYELRVPRTRAAGDYTPRIVPHHPLARIPNELPLIAWAGPPIGISS